MIREQSIILRKLLPREGTLKRILAYLEALPLGDNIEVLIRPYRSTRSNEQNRYLNGVAYKLLGDATGYERDEISEYMCGAYWGWKEKRVPKKPSNPEGFESVPVRTTTTDENGKRCVLTTLEFCDYVAFVQRFAAKKGVFIPDPDPDYKLHQENTAA